MKLVADNTITANNGQHVGEDAAATQKSKEEKQRLKEKSMAYYYRDALIAAIDGSVKDKIAKSGVIIRDITQQPNEKISNGEYFKKDPLLKKVVNIGDHSSYFAELYSFYVLLDQLLLESELLQRSKSSPVKDEDKDNRRKVFVIWDSLSCISKLQAGPPASGAFESTFELDLWKKFAQVSKLFCLEFIFTYSHLADENICPWNAEVDNYIKTAAEKMS